MNTPLRLMSALLAATGIYRAPKRLRRARPEPLAAQSVLGTASPDEVSFPSRDGRARVHASLLTAAQADAVRQFLRFIAERDAEEYAEYDDGLATPQRALDRYWSRA